MFAYRVVKRQRCLVGKRNTPGSLTSNVIPVSAFFKGHNSSSSGIRTTNQNSKAIELGIY